MNFSYEVLISSAATQDDTILEFHRSEMDKCAREKATSCRISGEVIEPDKSSDLWILRRTYTTGRN